MTVPGEPMLASIAARARPLHEREAMTHRRARRREAPPLDARRRGRWRAASARGVEADFLRRLGYLGLADPSDLADVLAEPEADPSAEIPAWLQVLVAAAGHGGEPRPTVSVPTAGHELDPLLAPLLEEARLRLARRAPPGTSDGVVNDLLQGLRGDLSRLTAPCVDTELAAFRTRAGPVVPHDLWCRFQREMLASGLFGFWDTYPVLARLVGVRLLHWVDRSAELLGRFEADRRDLAEFFDINQNHSGTARLDSVELTASDPHNGHAQVAVCTVSGTRVVYKPKDVSAELFLSELVRWCDGIGLDLGPAIDVLARDGYGWVGYVIRAPVDPEGAQRFYLRIGRLAALLFALGGKDAHAENVVARGDAPIVIDAETVLQPTLPTEDGSPVADWVIHGMVLPMWLGIGGTATDLSATGAPGTTWRRTELRWKNSGQAQMELVPVPVTVGDFPSALHSPTGQLYRPEDHAQQILSGFREGWALLCDHVGDFIGPGGWLDRLAHVRVRVLARMTRTYTRLLDTALDPNLLRSGVDRSIHLDHVARAAFDRDAELWLGLAEAERRMLEDGDVPFFSVPADEAALLSGDRSVLIGFEESSLAQARRRLAGLGDHDLELQLDVARAALAVAPPGCRSTAFEAALAPGRSAPDRGDPAAAAAAVSARMVAQVSRFGGPVAPLSLVAASPSQWAIDVPGPGLYDGRIGVAVALAGAAAALGDPAVAVLAREVAAPVLDDAVARPRRLVLRYGLGGQDGVGGILLGLALVQRITGASDPGLEAAFASLTRSVTDDDLAAADPLDLLAGLPGLLAGLAAGARAGWPAGTPIGPVARRVTDAVTAHLAAVESGAALARNGFSHGDAGLAALLAGLPGLVVGLEADASEEAFALAAALVAAESSRFDPEVDGWRDLRPGADPGGRGPGWCNGSPGIALSRALIAQCVGETAASAHGGILDSVAADLSRASAGLGTDRLPRDTLCCGRAGRLAVLQTLSGRPRYRRMYDEAAAALAAAASDEELRLGAPPSPIAPLGLFQGLGGVLYALARVARPDLPQILAWGVDLG